MIAYDELAAALERWRTRNGLPATPPLFAGAALPRATQAVAAVPPPTSSPAIVRSPPPPPASGRSTMIGMAAPAVAPPPAAAAMPLAAPLDEEYGEAEVLEEPGDQYDNEGKDFAVGFDGSTNPGAGSSADGWPEANTVMSHGWGQAATRATSPSVADDGEEATHIGDQTRHD